jgi:hypothetical protein
MKTAWEGGRMHRRHAAKYFDETAWEGGRMHRRHAAKYFDENRLERWKKALQARCRVSGWKPLEKVEECTAGMLQSIWMKTTWEGGRRHCRVSGWKPLGKVEEDTAGTLQSI